MRRKTALNSHRPYLQGLPPQQELSPPKEEHFRRVRVHHDCVEHHGNRTVSLVDALNFNADCARRWQAKGDTAGPCHAGHDNRLVATQKSRRDQTWRGGAQEATVEVSRKERLPRLVPAGIIRPRKLPSRLPVRRGEAETDRSHAVPPALKGLQRIFKIRASQAFLEASAISSEPEPYGIARLVTLPLRLRMRPIPATKGPFPLQWHPVERNWARQFDRTQALVKRSVSKNADSLS
jgi:hypothetical protein